MFATADFPEPPKRPEDEAMNRQDEGDSSGDSAKRPQRIGGEAAPDISPQQFQRLMDEGSVNIDSRGRVRSARSDSDGEGMSLRKRRAWYGG